MNKKLYTRILIEALFVIMKLYRQLKYKNGLLRYSILTVHVNKTHIYTHTLSKARILKQCMKSANVEYVYYTI